jgi:hypothetical protein
VRFIAGLLYFVVDFGLVEFWQQFENVLQVGFLFIAHLLEWGALVFHQVINAMIRYIKTRWLRTAALFYKYQSN